MIHFQLWKNAQRRLDRSLTTHSRRLMPDEFEKVEKTIRDALTTS